VSLPPAKFAGFCVKPNILTSLQTQRDQEIQYIREKNNFVMVQLPK